MLSSLMKLLAKGVIRPHSGACLFSRHFPCTIQAQESQRHDELRDASRSSVFHTKLASAPSTLLIGAPADQLHPLCELLCGQSEHCLQEVLIKGVQVELLVT